MNRGPSNAKPWSADHCAQQLNQMVLEAMQECDSRVIVISRTRTNQQIIDYFQKFEIPFNDFFDKGWNREISPKIYSAAFPKFSRWNI